MTVDLLYQPQALLPAAVAALQTITIGSPGTPVRVDVDAVQGKVAAPMLILERGAGQSWWRAPFDRDQLVRLPLDVTAIGESLDQASALIGRAVHALVGENEGGYIVPLTVTGLNVVHRELAGVLPRPQQAGGLAQALAQFVVTLERAS